MSDQTQPTVLTQGAEKVTKAGVPSGASNSFVTSSPFDEEPTASGSRKTTPVTGLVFPRPPTPPSKAFEVPLSLIGNSITANDDAMLLDTNSSREKALCRDIQRGTEVLLIRDLHLVLGESVKANPLGKTKGINNSRTRISSGARCKVVSMKELVLRCRRVGMGRPGV